MTKEPKPLPKLSDYKDKLGRPIAEHLWDNDFPPATDGEFEGDPTAEHAKELIEQHKPKR